jgi:hypothetical protein
MSRVHGSAFGRGFAPQVSEAAVLISDGVFEIFQLLKTSGRVMIWGLLSL